MGSYSVHEISAGMYIISASLVGFTPVAGNDTLLITRKVGNVLVHHIVMREMASQLEAVTVVAKKEAIEIQNGKLILNVQNSALTSGASALDLLRRIPGVSLGQDDQIMLKGSGGINVMIDGKMTYLSEQQLVQILRGVSAENISRVEVVSAPTAEYDAAGNAGIINFVTKKNLANGYSLDIRSGVSKGKFWMVNENVTGSYRNNKLNVFGSFDYNTPHRYTNGKSGNSFVENGLPIRISRENQVPHMIKFYTYKAGVDWQINPSHQISAGYNGYFDDFVKDNARSVVNKIDVNTNQIGSVHSNNYLEEPYHYDAANLSYKFEMDSTGKNLTADIHYVSYRNFSDGVLTTQEYGGAHEQIGETRQLQSHQPGTVQISSVKTDLELPFPAFTLKTGLKYAYVTNDNNFRFDSLINGRFVEASSMSNHFKYEEKIAAAYISASKKWARTSIEGGLRLESTIADGRTVKQGVDNHWQYTQLFPSLSVDHVLNNSSRLSLSLSRRINRPTYSNLNPVRWYADQYFFFYGNSNLRPEMAWLYSAAYTFKDKYVLTANYSKRSDYLSRSITVEPETNAVVSQAANFDKMRRFDLVASVPVHVSSFWNLQFTGGTNYTSYPIPLREGQSTIAKWAANVIASQQLTLPAGINVELTATWYSGELWGIYEKKSIFFTDFGIRKSFPGSRLDVRFSYNDFLRTNRYRAFSRSNFTDYQYNDLPDTRRLSLSVKYHLGGKLQSGQSRRIEEQDRL